jgi:ribosomal protein S18 acetylase RimI-like enzyme
VKVVVPTQEDYLQIAGLHNKASLPFDAIYSADEKLAFAETSTETYESIKETAQTRELLCVKDKDNKVLGYVSFRKKNEQTVWISSLYIDPAKQKEGIGSLLLREVEKYALRSFCPIVALETHKDAYWALNFYQKNGYKLINDVLSQYPFNAVLDKEPVKGRPLLAKLV